MDRYAHTFARLKTQKRIGFCPFAVLGDPTEAQCLKRIQIYLDAEPDFLEVGIPFSDPIADGPVVQAADTRALANGMTPKKSLHLIKKIRQLAEKNPATKNIPIGILTYSNIVLQYGVEKFYQDAHSAGADSILIADVPLEEIAPFAAYAKKYKLHQIFLVSEYTDTARLKKIEKVASGFLYVVSSLGVTGTRTSLGKSLNPLLKQLKNKTHLPLVVGFGISTPAHIKSLQKTPASAYIIGSALVKTPTPKLKKEVQLLKPPSVSR